MTTLTVQIDNDHDLPVLKEILNRFGLNYQIQNDATAKKNDQLYKKLKKPFKEIKEWEAGKINLQHAKEAIDEITAELDK